MRVFGNLMNRVIEMEPSRVPAVGMGATICAWSDRYAGTVTRITTGGVVWVREDKWVRVDDLGATDSGQKYDFETDSSGRLFCFKKNKAGRWVEVFMNPDTGRYKSAGRNNGVGLVLGRRDKYHDFSF